MKHLIVMQNLSVNEIFCSLQGEGARAGELSIFIRLSGCNLRCSFCDTDFTISKKISIEQIANLISGYGARWIVWTGGEPTLQLNDDIIFYFKQLGYKQALETNGTNSIPNGLDYICVSPKTTGDFSDLGNVNEVRIAVSQGDIVPDFCNLPIADHYFLSPIFSGDAINFLNLNYCIETIKDNNIWKLSIQQHKIWNVQ